jgi:hypothetical protein
MILFLTFVIVLCVTQMRTVCIRKKCIDRECDKCGIDLIEFSDIELETNDSVDDILMMKVIKVTSQASIQH